MIVFVELPNEVKKKTELKNTFCLDYITYLNKLINLINVIKFGTKESLKCESSHAFNLNSNTSRKLLVTLSNSRMT